MSMTAAAVPLCVCNAPRRCQVVAELPRNSIGRVQKNLLRSHFIGVETK